MKVGDVVFRDGIKFRAHPGEWVPLCPLEYAYFKRREKAGRLVFLAIEDAWEHGELWSYYSLDVEVAGGAGHLTVYYLVEESDYAILISRYRRTNDASVLTLIPVRG